MRELTIILLVWLSLVACSSTSNQAPVVSLSQLNLPQPEHHLGAEIPSLRQIFTLPDSAKKLLDDQFSRYAIDQDRVLDEFRHWMSSPEGFYVEYDNQTTFTVTQTFEERAGNCLSYSILTHAFADYLNLKAYFLEPDVPLFWQMQETFETIGDHINVYVRLPYDREKVFGPTGFIIDFSENDRFKYAKRYELSKEDIVGSFYHNRAAEALAQGDLPLAYSFAFHALNNKPQASKSYSLIGIVLRRMGNVELAEQAYNIGMQLDSMDPVLLNNLVYFYRSEERHYDALLLDLRLEQIQLESPFVIARSAEESFKDGSYKESLKQYNRAIRRADYIHNFYFGKARALLQLGEYDEAMEALMKAQELSTTREQNSKYGGKIAALNRLM
ncbi:hypothetical protein K0504_17595 [Neiella marina]|uniref:Uncharacterized protein n=1 Tax=Neiella holothuriorum TaxID=2870530 RepID=A0ABS7EKQ1_9GAMM|nr:hypothetical protein [Neiella holothuriorum]MBW8192855.1 hypothetical protein [Neiella holothuriorum]